MNSAKDKNIIKEIEIGFDDNILELDINQIIPVKIVGKAFYKSAKYKQIMASIEEVGIIEPPVVTPESKSKEHYILLDGHIRIEVLKELGIDKVYCLVSHDDESFTYNKHINKIAPVQENRMICRAIERGVSEEKIAKALNLNVKNIILKSKMLDGICQEVKDMLKDKVVAKGIFPILKKMKPYRQIEVVTLMSDANIYTASYIKALLAATPKEQLVNPEKPKSIKGLSEEQVARMESEMSSLQREYQLIEDNYGANVLNLTVAKSYIASLLDSALVVKYLAQKHPEMLSEFQKVTEIESLESI